MKALINISLCLFLILITGTGHLLAQTGNSSQSSSSSQSANASQSSRKKTANNASNHNSDSNSDDGISSKKGTGGQTGTKITKTIELKGETDNKEIIINVTEKDAELSININSVITEGILLIEIYDPSGEKTGNCSLDCTDSRNKNDVRNEITKNESASCSMSKSYNPPLPGKWKINIRSEKAKGTLKIDVN